MCWRAKRLGFSVMYACGHMERRETLDGPGWKMVIFRARESALRRSCPRCDQRAQQAADAVTASDAWYAGMWGR